MKLLKKIKLGNINFKNLQYVPPPVLYENIIYYCDNEFNIIAKSLDSGKVLWRTSLTLEDSENFSFIGGISLSGNNIFVTTGLGNIYKINKKRGILSGLKDFLCNFQDHPWYIKTKCL